MPATTFIPDYPTDQLAAADYNPRSITDEAFALLRESLRAFGLVKPVILNGDGTLVAGHQRTKAMHAEGITHTPAVRLGVQAALVDEVKFNLMHNAVESEVSDVRLDPPEGGWQPGTYAHLPAGHVHGGRARGAGSYLRESCELIVAYGAWGSVVVDTAGRVVQNAEYALACQLLGEPVLTYVIPDEHRDPYLELVAGTEFGRYDFTALAVRPYNQFYVQPNRLRGADGQSIQSTTYEQHVRPRLTPGGRLVDFGCGHGDYVRRLRAEGYQAFGYEPYPQVRLADGRTARRIDVRRAVGQLAAIEADVAAHGLFPIVVLDSVLNAVTSLDFERHVLSTANSLCAADGTLVLGTRALSMVEAKARLSTGRSNTGRLLQFLDADNFSATFREGVWNLMRFHSAASLQQALDPYFADVEVTVKGRSRSNLWAICRGPRRLDPGRLRESLDVELNMPYPDGFRHGRHERLRDLLLELAGRR